VQSLENRIQDGVRPSHHVAIPEPENPETSGLQECISVQIFWRPFEMAAAVKLDYDLGLNANEVTDINIDWVLPPELEAVDLPATQPAPKALLGLRLVLAQFAGEMNHLGR
jgi:hypothetical protein